MKSERDKTTQHEHAGSKAGKPHAQALKQRATGESQCQHDGKAAEPEEDHHCCSGKGCCGAHCDGNKDVKPTTGK